MSKRPTNAKRAARMRKAIERQPLPRFIDPVQWLRDRRYAQTNGAARDIILAGRLKSESHTLGVGTEPRRQENGEVKNEKVVTRVPASYRSTLRVEAA